MAFEKYEVFSAGTEATEVNPLAIEVLKEIDVNVEGLRSKVSDEFLEMDIMKVVTVCDNAREACPFFPGAKEYVHHGFQDPPVLVKEQGLEPLEAFRMVRDDIKGWLEAEFL
jgi:arsenate reductase